MMTTITAVADRLLARVAPKATAQACGACTTNGPYSGPCPGGYGYYKCCYGWLAGVCRQFCNFIC